MEMDGRTATRGENRGVEKNKARPKKPPFNAGGKRSTKRLAKIIQEDLTFQTLRILMQKGFKAIGVTTD